MTLSNKNKDKKIIIKPIFYIPNEKQMDIKLKSDGKIILKYSNVIVNILMKQGSINKYLTIYLRKIVWTSMKHLFCFRILGLSHWPQVRLTINKIVIIYLKNFG